MNRLLLLVCACACAGAAHTQQWPPLEKTMAEVARATNYTETALSPDAHWVAWAQSSAFDAKATSIGSEIYLASAAHSDEVHRVTAASPGGGGTDHAIQEKALAWSPDSKSLAFLSDAESPGQLELYSMNVADHSVRRLTQLKGFLATPGWSRDGKTIAFLFTENAARAAGPLEAVPQETGVIGQQILEQRIATVDIVTGVVKQISPSDLYVYEYDWSPDGKTFAATAAHGSGDNNWYVAEIYRIGRDDGRAQSIFKSSMQIAVPRWSPDGRRIAFIGGLMSDESIGSGDLYVIPASGGGLRI